MIPAKALPTLQELEAVVEGGLRTFVEVGEALLAIRDRRLYREQGFDTFETYCRERWRWGRNYVNKQIAAAEVVRELGTVVPKPEAERQVRELVRAPVEERQQIWDQAVEEAQGKQPTAINLAALVRERMKLKGYEPAPERRQMTREERTELRELQESAKRGTEWAGKYGTILRAIETLEDPPLDLAIESANMRRWDPEVKARIPKAITNLKFLEDLL